ncbi:MAG: hypothetical protein H0U35_12750 [Sporichthyaceae bacterium]|nr:hypothetical protein [Sporichthyaceae bacterium]
MRRHELDLVSLIAGVVFLIVAVSHLVGAATDITVDLDWLAPVALVGLGVAGLAGSLRHRPTDREQAEGPTGEL